MAAPVVIGCDVGKRVDSTAIAVVELQWRGGSTRNLHDHYVVRELGRLPLGTDYPRIAAEVARVFTGVQARVERVEAQVGRGTPRAKTIVREERPSVTLYVDATGVGEGVVDLLDGLGVHARACYFVHGEKRTTQGREVKLGKAWMVSRLQTLAQSGRLHLPATSEAEAARRELLDYEIRVSDDGMDSYGAFKTGRHDDLVTALGLATQPPGQPAYVW